MLILALLFSAFSLILVFSFYRKYQVRLRSETQSTLRYNRIADYFGRPIRLTFEYRPRESDTPTLVEADVEEIYHYGRDYFLKGYPSNRRHPQVFKWSRVSNPRVHTDGRSVESLEALFLATQDAQDAQDAQGALGVEDGSSRAIA